MPLRIERVIDCDLYPPEALADAQSAFAAYCDLRLVPIDAARWRATVEVPADDPAAAREIALSCLNYALDRAAQILLDRA
jgi:hypothetical protein